MHRVVISNKQDFQKLILTRIATRALPVQCSKNLDRTNWLDPSSRNGISAAIKVQFGGYNYRINANTDVIALAAVVHDMNDHALAGLSFTKTLGERCDVCSRKSVRTGIYMYRKPK